jgi:hypothetical protein
MLMFQASAAVRPRGITASARPPRMLPAILRYR